LPACTLIFASSTNFILGLVYSAMLLRVPIFPPQKRGPKGPLFLISEKFA
jgi:hypothetical protein